MAQTDKPTFPDPTPPDGPYLERRTYVAAPGKFEAILNRFRDHTFRYFARHGIRVVSFGYQERDPGILEYLIAWEGAEHKRRAWPAFVNDPEWAAARAESERDGKLVDEVYVELWLVPEWGGIPEGREVNAPIRKPGE